MEPTATPLLWSENAIQNSNYPAPPHNKKTVAFPREQIFDNGRVKNEKNFNNASPLL